jgi:transposase-like protein
MMSTITLYFKFVMQRFYDTTFPPNLTQRENKLQFNHVMCVMNNFGLISQHKFVKIHIDTANYMYNRFMQSTLQYKDSTILILHKT